MRLDYLVHETTLVIEKKYSGSVLQTTFDNAEAKKFTNVLYLFVH